MVDPPPRLSRTLDRLLTQEESVELQVHQHPMMLWRPALQAVGGTVVWLWLVFGADAPTGRVMDVLTLAVLALWLWLGWSILEWRHNWFIATDKRILMYRGLVTRDVPMMRLSKVTDMRYHRSVPGLIFGYGEIIIESAGQDQALNDLTFLPYPDETYATLCEVIFGEKPRRKTRRPGKIFRRHNDPDLTPGPDDVHITPRPSVQPRAPHERDLGKGKDSGRDKESGNSSLYQSPDLRRSPESSREADTGPIPIVPPGYYED